MSIKEEILEVIAFQTAVSPAEILNSNTWKEAGIDSLDTLEIMLTVSEKFGIEINEDDEETLVNFNALIEYLELKNTNK
jgi:acyl carrier protein